METPRRDSAHAKSEIESEEDASYTRRPHKRSDSKAEDTEQLLGEERPGYRLGGPFAQRWRRLIYGSWRLTAMFSFIVLVVVLFVLSDSGTRVAQSTIMPGSLTVFTGGKRRALVIASYTDQELEWLSEIPPDWETYRYLLDVTPGGPETNLSLTVPRNQGREAMAYLTFIIDNYDVLPDYVVFIHGHGRSWHQVEPLLMKLRALNLTALDIDRYVNLRCQLPPTCTPNKFVDATRIRHPLYQHPQDRLMPGFWRTIFPKEMDYLGMGPPPKAIGGICCAQFAVTKDAIQFRSKEFWETLRAPLLRDMSEYKKSIGKEINSFRMGLLYELIWHMMFGKEAVHCPPAEYCLKTQFSDKIECDWYPSAPSSSEGWENSTCRWKGDSMYGGGYS